MKLFYNKILFIIIVIGVFMFSMMNNSYSDEVRNVGDDYVFVYHIIDPDGSAVTGETVNLKIIRASDFYELDFDDNTFKSSGWTTQELPLIDDIDLGFYYYMFEPPTTEDEAEQYIFLIDNTSEGYGDHRSQTVSYQDIASQITANIIKNNTDGVKQNGAWNTFELFIRKLRGNS